MGARSGVAAARLADIVRCYLGSWLEQCDSANSSSLSEILSPDLEGGMFFCLFSSMASDGAELELPQLCSCAVHVSGAELGKPKICS